MYKNVKWIKKDFNCLIVLYFSYKTILNYLNKKNWFKKSVFQNKFDNWHVLPWQNFVLRFGVLT